MRNIYKYDIVLFILQIPRSEEGWREVANGFCLKWNFPHCIGALDGKHVQIEAPENSGSVYYNYHGTFSIVLMAIADADYRIIYADVGCQGRISDGGVFANTTFYNKLINNELKLPKPTCLSEKIQSQVTPFVLVADDAFSLNTNLMKPFPGPYPKGSQERAFNYRLSRARRIIENVFGLLATVFRVFRKPIPLHPKKVESVVLACIYLHNFLRRNAQSVRMYTPPGTFDSEDLDTGSITPGSWRAETEGSLLDLQRIPRNASQEAKEIRKEFAKYFISEEGKVPWQDRFA